MRIRETIGFLYLSDVFALHLWPLDLPFVTKYCKQRIRNNLGQTETPDKCDGIEKVCVARAGVYPEIVEGRSEQGRVQDRGYGKKGVSHHCRSSIRAIAVEVINR